MFGFKPQACLVRYNMYREIFQYEATVHNNQSRGDVCSRECVFMQDLVLSFKKRQLKNVMFRPKRCIVCLG